MKETRAIIPAVAPAPKNRWALGAVLVALVTTAAWSNSLHGPFVFDDLPSIVDNESIRHFSSAFFPPVGGITVSGRPVLNFSLALNFAISGDSVIGYHALNLIIHALAGLTLFGLVRRTLRSESLALRYGANANGLAALAAMLWSVHPLQTESVTYLVQRAESLSGFLYLQTLYCFARGARSPVRSRWHGASVIACLLGVATKETVATAPLLVLLYDRTFFSGSFREAWRRHRRVYGGLAASWLVLGCLVMINDGRAGSAGFNSPVAWWRYALKQFQAETLYLRRSFWPHPLVLDYGANVDVPPHWLASGIALIGTLLATTVIALWRWPAWGFLGAWFFVILAPSSSILPIATQAMAEHRMYLSLAAVIVATLVLFHHWLGSRALFAGLALVAIFTGLTLQRNRDYRSWLTLWTQALAASDNPRAHLNLGYALVGAGRPAEAIAHYAAAAQSNTEAPEAHYDWGNALLALGRSEEAATHFKAAIRLKPTLVEAHYNLGNVEARVGHRTEAIRLYRTALQIKPSHAGAHYNLANALVEEGRLAEAIAHYRSAVQLSPGLLDAHFNLGNALMQSGQPAAAAQQYETVLRLNPQDAEAARNLALARNAPAPP